jgi:hypothetical protein
MRMRCVQCGDRCRLHPAGICRACRERAAARARHEAAERAELELLRELNVYDDRRQYLDVREAIQAAGATCIGVPPLSRTAAVACVRSADGRKGYDTYNPYNGTWALVQALRNACEQAVVPVPGMGDDQ